MNIHNYLNYYRCKIRSQFFMKRVSSAGKGAMIWGKFEVVKPENLICGKNLTVNFGVYINASEKIIIGDNVSLSAGSMLITTGLVEGGLSTKEHYSSPINIGTNVQVGAGAIILPGVTIGNNVIVGAGSVVTKNIPDNSVVVGTPAKKIKSI